MRSVPVIVFVLAFLHLLTAASPLAASPREDVALPRHTLSEVIRQAQAADETLGALARRAEQLRLAWRLVGAPPSLAARLSAVAGQPPDDSNVLTQQVELGGQPGLRRELAAAELRMAEAEMAERRLVVAWQLASACSALAAARKTVLLDREELASQDALLRMTRRRYEVGDIPEMQVVRMEREHDRALRVVHRAEQEELATRGVLLGLLGLASTTPLELEDEPPPEPPADVTALVSEGWRERPDLLMLRAEVKVRLADAALVHAQRAPTLELQVRQTRWSAPVSQVGANLSVTWALLDWGQQRAQVAQARGRVEEARARLATRTREAEAQVREAYARWERLRRERLTLESADLQHATRLTHMVERGYLAGLVTQLEVIEARTALREVRIEAARLRAQEAAATWDLWRAAGRGQPEHYLQVRQPGGVDHDRP